ncbi:MAG: translation initiation factor IF-3 [Alphaproteobacteria bacterium]|nr:translation initiation factor IF-3 [Alphaproteobacteria bacterium]
MRKPAPPGRTPRDDGPRINRDIRADKIRLVDADGTMVGVVSVSEGLRRAEEAGLDLVEVSPNADPPVCKVLDYGKYKYEQQKKAAEARKKQKTIDVKEIKIRPSIEEHDYGVKLRNARRFLEDGDKVKVTMRFRGREMSHQEIGMQVLEKFRDDLSDLGKVEVHPKLEGRQMMMMMAPDKV